MARVKQLQRQTDFSAGELDSDALRLDDDPVRKAGLRQAQNWRITGRKKLENRPGRRTLFMLRGRVDEVRMTQVSPDPLRICFTASGSTGSWHIRNADGDIVSPVDSPRPWTVDTVGDIVWDVFGEAIIACYPGMQPRVAIYSPITDAWTFADFSPLISATGRASAPFWRISRKGVTLQPSGSTGAINLTFSDNILESGMIGTRLRYSGRQMTITGVTTPTTGTADVIEQLLGAQRLTFSSTTGLTLGDTVEGLTSGAKGVITAVTATTIDVTIEGTTPFTTADDSFGDFEIVKGPLASYKMSAAPTALSPPASVEWDEEVMNDYRGWPRSVTADRNRLIFTDFPGLPRGIAWSKIGIGSDLEPGADADEAIFELYSRESRVYHVMGGDDQFVFTDSGVSNIPISNSSPLVPGSVEFRRITPIPCSRVRPIDTGEGLAFVSSGGRRVLAIVGTGQTQRPYIVRPVSEYQSHLFNDVRALAIEFGDINFAETYLYVLNGDGTMAVGRYDGGRDWVGWVPWRPGGPSSTFQWVSAAGSRALFVTEYILIPNINRAGAVEQLDVTAYLDHMVPLNDIPTALAPGTGAGTYWFWRNATITIMDGLRFVAQRKISTLDEIILEEGDDFTSETLVGGFHWESIAEPFLSHGAEGTAHGQTVEPRVLSAVAIAYQDSTGFWLKQLKPVNSGATTADVDLAVEAPYTTLDNEDAAPPQRDGVKVARPQGNEFDHRLVLVKDTPGTLRIVEMSTEGEV